MHQLDGVSVRQICTVQLRSAHNLPVQLDHDGTGIESQLTKEVGCRSRSFEAPGFAVNNDFDRAHLMLAQGDRNASVAAAGSGEVQSARIAATP